MCLLKVVDNSYDDTLIWHIQPNDIRTLLNDQRRQTVTRISIQFGLEASDFL